MRYSRFFVARARFHAGCVAKLIKLFASRKLYRLSLCCAAADAILPHPLFRGTTLRKLYGCGLGGAKWRPRPGDDLTMVEFARPRPRPHCLPRTGTWRAARGVLTCGERRGGRSRYTGSHGPFGSGHGSLYVCFAVQRATLSGRSRPAPRPIALFPTLLWGWCRRVWPATARRAQ